MSGSTSARPFAELTPDRVLEAAEALELEPDGRLFALNSYENRVYQVGSAAVGSVIFKFYRAGRWSDAQILEEHAFAGELRRADLPVSAPLEFSGRTLIVRGPWRYAVFPRESARAVEIDASGSLEWIGRTLGRMHAVGARRRFTVRPSLTVDRLGWQARDAVLAAPELGEFEVESTLFQRYGEASEALLDVVERRLSAHEPLPNLRLHGDCHLGNILWNEHGPVFVDLDDCMMGPRIQDLWMFLSGSRDDRERQWTELMAGYRLFHEIDESERELVEALRALRMIHHAAWIVTRWQDPAFPRAFPGFSTSRYWQEYVSDLWQQVEAVS